MYSVRTNVNSVPASQRHGRIVTPGVVGVRMLCALPRLKRTVFAVEGGHAVMHLFIRALIHARRYCHVPPTVGRCDIHIFDCVEIHHKVADAF